MRGCAAQHSLRVAPLLSSGSFPRTEQACPSPGCTTLGRRQWNLSFPILLTPQGVRQDSCVKSSVHSGTCCSHAGHTSLGTPKYEETLSPNCGHQNKKCCADCPSNLANTHRGPAGGDSNTAGTLVSVGLAQVPTTLSVGSANMISVL